MTHGRGLQVLIAAALVVLLAGGALFFARRPPEVETLTVAPQKTERVLAVVGRVRPLDLVEVKSPNPGQVVRMLHDEGDRVAAGEPLAVVKANVERAQNEADLARVAAARAEVAQAQLTFSRTQTLAARGFASKAALDQSQAALRTAEAAAAAAAATARASSARMEEFVVRAPMAGVVLLRPVDNGQVVSTTTTLFELGSLDGREIQAEVDEAYADAVRVGMDARAALSGSGAQFPARVSEVSPQVNSSTGGRLIKLVPTGGAALAPGRSVDVTIVIDPGADLIVIPRQAVIDATVAPKVYLLDSEQIPRLRAVSVANWPSQDAIVQRGLAAGDRIVLAPAKIKAGRRVRPVRASVRE